MKIWIDTMEPQEIEFAADSGLLTGVTCNPSILAKAGGNSEERIADALNIQSGPVCVQLLRRNAVDMTHEAQQWLERFPYEGERLIFKLPVTPQGYLAIGQLTAKKLRCLATAIFTPLQGLLAARAGACYLAPYLSRIDANGGNSLDVAGDLVSLMKIHDLGAVVLGAGFKDSTKMTAYALAGVPEVTVPAAVFREMIATHPLTERAIFEFEEAMSSSTASL